MTRPSKAGEILIIIFGLVFLSAGVFFASTVLFGAPGQVEAHGNRWVGVLISSIFILIGGGIAGGAIYGNRKLEEQAAAEQSNPESPWLWRKDWAARRAESKNRNSAIGLWILAVFANTIAFTVAAATVPAMWRNSDPKAFFPLLFCVAGVVLAGAAIRASIRRERFGQTYFEFASLPFSPGGSLQGTIHLRFNTDARHGIDLSLACVRQVITGAGKNRSTQETILWQADKNVPQSLLAPGPMGDALIPVDFTIPSDAYESNHEQPSDQVLWLLHAQADVPGVNYSDDFEVPVFRLAPSSVTASEPAARFANQAEEAVAPAFLSDASDVPAPANPKVIVSVGMNGGTEFYFPAFRNPTRVLFLLLFTAVWTGVVYFLAHSKAPWFFALFFGLFDLLLIYGLTQSALGSFRIEVANGRIVFRRALLGMGTSREIPFSEIAQILPVTAMQQQGVQASYSVRLQTRTGTTLTLADAIDNRQEARWVTAQLEKLAGLKLDTHVAVQAGFGVNGPPPQRGQAGSGSPAAFRRNSPLAMAVGLAFFFAWAGFIGYHIFSGNHRGPNRVSRTRVSPVGGGPARSSLRQVSYSPLSDADVQHLRTLPDQAQAEELLDRAIHHDLRALDLFEKNIGVWRNISRTAQMNELEERSRFSTDLRVRYANADLNLALDGFQKTDESADQLIAQAQADLAHRPYSVYHMGMLAGRGVGYDRIYPVLLDYAKNDPNPEVRQWAVEGMRFLGTDEALEQLFDAFTHDSSNAVRDRAGCNVSDCGNFMRKQRMRMVPRLIELAADPQTTPQMRNWTFMALHEITDATLPADAALWQNWYRQHGAEKMVDFERMEWWRVRGDQ
ncbi:MAG: HEAT repeat domain-containing protein [Terriglobales bacterium]